MIGHEHMQGKGYEHFWGIGRHSLGSQVFDYWGDPWGRVHEHWADTDVLNASIPANLFGRGELDGPWGGPIRRKVHAPRGPVGRASAVTRSRRRRAISRSPACGRGCLASEAQGWTAPICSKERLDDENLCPLRPAVHRGRRRGGEGRRPRL